VNFEAYMGLATRTENKDFNTIGQRVSIPRNLRLLHGVVGVVTELEELQQAVDKAWVDHAEGFDILHTIDKVNAAEEVGDLFWYCAQLSDEVGVSKTPTVMAQGHFLEKLRLMNNIAVDALDHLKKVIFYGKPLDEQKLIGMTQFILIFAASMAADFDTTPEAIMAKNIAKLAARYGDKFSDVRAENRDLGTERQILEGAQNDPEH
jgi:hypothetical protein